MSAHTLDFIEAIEHLPDGAMLRLENISWDEYEELLEELNAWPGMRVSYDHGRVQIMSPTTEHEHFKTFVARLVHLLAEVTTMDVEYAGATTYKLKELLRGSEPDESFYVKNAHAIIGKRHIDLNTDPPPDVVVEVDITSESLDKFPIYAAFAVPEIWRYDGKQARIYHLLGESYVEAESSLSFPILTAQALSDFLEQSKTEGQTAALLAFREWVRSQLTA